MQNDVNYRGTVIRMGCSIESYYRGLSVRPSCNQERQTVPETAEQLPILSMAWLSRSRPDETL